MALKSKSKAGRGGKGSGFKYHPRTSEDVRKRADQQGGRFDSIVKSGFDTWRPRDGENVVRILPPTWDDHSHYGFDVWVHSYVGPDKSTYLCPLKMGKSKSCPICKAAAEAQRAGEEEDAKALKPKQQVAVWILDRNADKETPSIWTMSWSMDRDIATLCQNKRTGKVLLIDNPYQGYDISFTRTGKGLNTRYVGIAVDREETAAMDDEGELESVLEYIQENPIPETLNYYDEDYLANMIEGTAEAGDEDLEDEDDEDERPRDRGKKLERSARGKSGDDDEEDEVEEDEDEEEDAPSRGKRTPSRRSARDDEPEDEEDEEEPEDDDEDEVEEEDEPAPRGKSKPKRAPSRRVEPEDEEDEEEPDEEDEVEEDDEEDDEEDEPPRRSTKKPVRRPGRR